VGNSEYQINAWLLSKAGVGNLSLEAGRQETLQGMAGPTNFPPTIRFPLLFVMLLKLRHLTDFSSD